MFNYSPTITILQQLVLPALLINNIEALNKAVRLSVILKSLYEQQPSFDKHNFTYQEYQTFLFKNASEFHPRDTKPTHEEPECRCNKTIKQLLFPSINANQQWQQWKDSFIDYYANVSHIEDIQSYTQSLEEQYPFQVTGKTIINDLDFLSGKHRYKWLEKIPNKNSFFYQKLTDLPTLKELIRNNVNIEMPKDGSKYPFISADDLQLFTDVFSQPIRGIQRFFIHPEDQIHGKVTKNVYALEKELRMIWEQTPVPLLEITYLSASSGNQHCECLVYPVCIYYYQRSFYLCALGTTPKNQESVNWYNYRLERIQFFKQSDCNSGKIFEKLQKRCQQTVQSHDDDLPLDKLIVEIQTRLDDAYGVDFYQNSDEMLIRFPRDFHNRYIQNTFRHQTFKKIDYEEAKTKITQSSFSPQEKENLMRKLQNFPEDAYYILRYRKEDNSVIMRLRAWGPNIEVFLPRDLRQLMKEDTNTTWSHYQDDI